MSIKVEPKITRDTLSENIRDYVSNKYLVLGNCGYVDIYEKINDLCNAIENCDSWWPEFEDPVVENALLKMKVEQAVREQQVCLTGCFFDNHRNEMNFHTAKLIQRELAETDSCYVSYHYDERISEGEFIRWVFYEPVELEDDCHFEHEVSRMQKFHEAITLEIEWKGEKYYVFTKERVANWLEYV